MEKPRVLIADDSPSVVPLLAAVLGSEYELIIATDGPATIEKAHEHLPDLILLDVIMPGLDGFEVCRRLKADERTQRIPIIFITGLDEVKDELHGLELGAIDFISKPILPAVVSLRVRNHIELKRYRDFLEDLSLVDGLTGIGNRRRFNEFLERECRRARRQASSVGLLLADVDFFKALNDHYGHAEGDDVLRKVADAMALVVRRPGDLVARYGGEEFAVVLAQTDVEGARLIGERMRAAVEALAIPHAGSLVKPVVTISIGTSAASGEGADPAALLKAADRQLYEAKRSGRNQVL